MRDILQFVLGPDYTNIGGYVVLLIFIGMVITICSIFLLGLIKLSNLLFS